MSAQSITDDISRPFQLEQSALRGRLIRLGETIDRVLTRHDYPPAVSRLLGEMFVLAATLAGGLKFNGTFSLQTRSDGPVSLMVADCTNEGAMRGYAKFDPEAVAAAKSSRLPDLLGHGHFAVTVDQEHQAIAYQGLVELAGDNLTDCIHSYFRQSEQVRTGMKIAVDRVEQGSSCCWRAGAVMVQSLPDPDAAGFEHSSGLEDWRRTMILLETVTERELLDPDLSPDALLLRLFHQEGVRVFDPLPLSFRCRCSRKRVAVMLSQFSADDLASMRLEDGSLNVTCEFCNEDYPFSAEDLASLLPATRH